MRGLDGPYVHLVNNIMFVSEDVNRSLKAHTTTISPKHPRNKMLTQSRSFVSLLLQQSASHLWAIVDRPLNLLYKTTRMWTRDWHKKRTVPSYPCKLQLGRATFAGSVCFCTAEAVDTLITSRRISFKSKGVFGFVDEARRLIDPRNDMH